MPKNQEGEDDNDDEDDIEELERKLRAAELPDHALKVAMKEIKVCVILLYLCYIVIT